MAEDVAKIHIQVEADNKALKDFTEHTAKLQGELKGAKDDLKKAEKEFGATSSEANKARAEIEELNRELKRTKEGTSSAQKELKNLSKSMQETQSSADALKGVLKDTLGSALKDKLGVDVSGITEKFKSFNLAIGATVTAAAAVTATLIGAARDVSAFSNQFLTYTGNVKDATEMYNKFNEVYRNTNYDEAKVYDMAKGFLNVGINADEAANLIGQCADTSASLGRGVEFAEELGDAFKRLATGGQLTEKQFKALAEAGIDLSDVQEDIRKGGVNGFNALKKALERYEGGMARSKQTAAEMEGDIKGNLIEIGRQTALLIDEIFGFSEALRSFYQWVIDTSQAVIDGIKAMIATYREASAAASDYADAMAAYGEIDEDDADAVAKRAQAVNEMCEAMRAERKDAEELEKQYKALDQARKPVTSIAKTTGGGSSGGGSSKGSAVRSEQELERDLVKLAADKLKLEEQINKEQVKASNIAYQNYIRDLTGLDLKKAQQEQAEKNAFLEIQNVEKVTAATIAAKQKEIDQIQTAINNGTAPDGSQKKIDLLTEEIALLQKLGEQQVANAAAKAQADALDKDKQAQSQPGGGIAGALQDVMAQGVQLNNLSKTIATSVSNNFTTMFTSIMNGSKSAGEAMQEFAKNMITQALSMMAQWLAIFAVVSCIPGMQAKAGQVATKAVFGLKDGGPVEKAGGGAISGPGTSISDSIPAMLSNGEYVLNARATKSIGVNTLNAMNETGAVPVAGGGSVTLNVSAMDASSFGDFLARGGGNVLAQYTKDLNRSFSTDGVW